MKKQKPKPTVEAGFDLLTPVKYYYCEEFETNGKQLLAYREETDAKAYKKSDRLNIKNRDPALQALSENVKYTNVYTPATQLIMFKKYNYIKHLAENARRGLTECPLSAIKDSDIRTWLVCNNLAIEVRNKIISNNIKLLLFTIAHVIERKKLVVEYEHILSECINKMFVVVEGFNYTLDFQFSTYLYRSINNFINLLIKRKLRDVERFKSAGDIDYSVFNSSEDDKIFDKSDFEYIQTIISTLDTRSQHVVASRFGIGTPKKSLIELAKQYNVTKERIRQIEIRALKNIRMQMSLSSKRYQQELSHMITY